MRVAAVQFKAQRLDLHRSREALVELADRAATGSDLVVLPEMAVCGYVFPDRSAVEAVAEAPDGVTFQALSAVAACRKTWVVAGFAELAGDQLFNSAMVIDGAGELAFVYRKTLLYQADVCWATPGDSGYRSFDTPAGRFTVGICMDLNDAWFASWMAVAGVDVVAFPTNWVQEEGDVHAYWRYRLSGTGAVLVAANTWGREGQIEFSGRSAILSHSTTYAVTGPTGDDVVRAVVSVER